MADLVLIYVTPLSVVSTVGRASESHLGHMIASVQIFHSMTMLGFDFPGLSLL